MKRTLFILCLLVFSLNSHAKSSSACDNLYNKVTYALSHTKKAMEMTNLEHLQYYAERALTAIEKAEAYTNDCGCTAAEENSYQSIKNLEKAVDATDWETGRFYSKKSLNLIDDLISILDTCSYDTDGDTTEELLEDKGVSTKSDEIDQKVVELAKYISTAEKSLKTTEIELNQLLEHILYKNKKVNTTSIDIQQKLYADKTKKLLLKALNALEEK